MTAKRTIHKSDLLDMESYAAQRRERRQEMISLKKNRRVSVGPFVTMMFECYDTMVYQIQEMLHTERGGDDQVAEEIAAYDPLVPKGNELVVTMLIDIENSQKRTHQLARLGGIEEHCTLSFSGYTLRAGWEQDIDRTTPEGKTSSVHFLHFKMTTEQAQVFPSSDKVTLAIDHHEYSHSTTLSHTVQAHISKDL